MTEAAYSFLAPPLTILRIYKILGSTTRRQRSKHTISLDLDDRDWLAGPYHSLAEDDT